MGLTHKPWDKVFPIGLQYGNDPEVLQAEYNKGERPKQLWINPDATTLLKELGGKVGGEKRPWFGWHDRLDGCVFDLPHCTRTVLSKFIIVWLMTSWGPVHPAMRQLSSARILPRGFKFLILSKMKKVIGSRKTGRRRESGTSRFIRFCCHESYLDSKVSQPSKWNTLQRRCLVR